VDGSGRNFLGRFLGGKASPSSFLVTIASRVLRLLSKNAVNRGFLRFSKSMECCQVLATKRLWRRVEEGREFCFRGDLYSQESTFPQVSNRIVNLRNNLSSSTTDFSSFRKSDKSLNNDYL